MTRRRGSRWIPLGATIVLVVSAGIIAWPVDQVATPFGPRTAASAAGASETASILVRVVRGDTGAVVPYHDVLVWRGSESFSRRGCYGDLEAALRPHATPTRTDAAGIIRIESSYAVKVFGRVRNLIGSVSVLGRAGHGEVRQLVLNPERRFSVRAVDPSGKPWAGVMLHATLQTIPRGLVGDLLRATGIVKPAREFCLGVTDDAGTIEWNDIALRRAGHGLGAVTGLRLRAVLPGVADAIEQVDGLPDDGSTIDVTLPASGQLTVGLIDADGQPVGGGWKVTLRDSALPTAAPRRYHQSESVTKTTRGGAAHFPVVPFDALYEVAVPYAREVAVIQVTGPTVAQPHPKVEVALRPAVPLLRGRAVDTAGKPLGSVRLLVTTQPRTGPIETRWWQTDDNAVFVAPLPAGVGPPKLARISTFSPQHSVDLLPHAPFAAGVTDLGDVVFATPPLLVGGEVRCDPHASSQHYSVGIEHLAIGGDPDRGWRWCQAEVIRDGHRFAAHAHRLPGDYRVRITPSAHGHVRPEPVPFEPGERNLAVHLDRGHTLRLRLRIPGDGKNFRRHLAPFRLGLRPTAGAALRRAHGGSQRNVSLGTGDTDRQGYRDVFCHGLESGVYRFEVAFRGATETPFFFRNGIHVPGPADAPADTRVDMVGALQSMELRFTGAIGRAAEGPCEVQLFHQGRRLLHSGSSVFQPKLSLIVRPGAMDVWIAATGCAPVALHAIEGDCRVELTPSRVRVAVRAASPTALPKGFALRITLTSTVVTPEGWQMPPLVAPDPQAGTWMSLAEIIDRSWPKWVATMLDHRSRGRLTVDRPGPQAVTLELITTTSVARVTATQPSVLIHGVTPTTIAITAAGAPQRLDLVIPPAAMRDALRRLGVADPEDRQATTR